jgi:hypothetical protein
MNISSVFKNAISLILIKDFLFLKNYKHFIPPEKNNYVSHYGFWLEVSLEWSVWICILTSTSQQVSSLCPVPYEHCAVSLYHVPYKHCAASFIVSCPLWALMCVIWLLVLCHWIYAYILYVLWPCSGYLSYYKSLKKKVKFLILKRIFPCWVPSQSTSRKYNGWWFLACCSHSCTFYRASIPLISAIFAEEVKDL